MLTVKNAGERHVGGTDAGEGRAVKVDVCGEPVVFGERFRIALGYGLSILL